MIHFPPIKTGRLDVRLRELTVAQAVQLAATPLTHHETAADMLLSFIVDSAGGQHQHPATWTVQERMFVVAHYIAHTSDGGGNFALGDGRFLDYLQASVDAAPELADAGQACGDAWSMRQLTGAEAVAMQSFCRSRMDWLTADMAARLFVPGADEPPRPDPVQAPGNFTAWLQERMSVFQQMPESDFEELFEAYERGRQALHHLFWLSFDDHGHVVLPTTTEGGDQRMAPARFPAATAVGRVTRWMGQRPDR